MRLAKDDCAGAHAPTQAVFAFAIALSPAVPGAGARFVADLDAPLDFGETTRTGGQLAAVGGAPVPDSTLKARLVAEVSSATATRDTTVTAILTEPMYSPAHQLLLPANSRLIGRVLQAKPAHKMHHNGELRVIFERIETSEEAVQALSQMQAQAEHLQAGSQAMVGNLEGLEVARSAHMKLDEEGGARTTDSKTRYLSTGSRFCWRRPRRILMPSVARRTPPVIQGCGLPPGFRLSFDGRRVESGSEVHTGFDGLWRLRRFGVDLLEFPLART